MKNEPNQSNDENADAFAPFEQQLRSHSLGPCPTRDRELMYECGYAAGTASEKRKSHRSTTRWRAASLLASILAGVSLVSHFSLNRVNRHEQLGNGQTISEPPHTSTDANLESINGWGTQLSRPPYSDQQTGGILRASTSAQDVTNLDVPDVVSNPAPSNTQSTPLRPIDFTQLL